MNILRENVSFKRIVQADTKPMKRFVCTFTSPHVETRLYRITFLLARQSPLQHLPGQQCRVCVAHNYPRIIVAKG